MPILGEPVPADGKWYLKMEIKPGVLSAFLSELSNLGLKCSSPGISSSLVKWPEDRANEYLVCTRVWPHRDAAGSNFRSDFFFLIYWIIPGPDDFLPY